MTKLEDEFVDYVAYHLYKNYLLRRRRKEDEEYRDKLLMYYLYEEILSEVP